MNIKSKKLESAKESVKEEKKPKTLPLKYSNWLITINSNKNLLAMNQEEREQTKKNFEKVIDEFFNEKIADFIVMKSSTQATNYGLPKDASREELTKRIEDVSVEYVLEIGNEKNTLHTHALFSIKKRGLETKLDYKKIREYINEKCGYVCHLDCRLYTDSKKNLEHYLQKTLSK